MAILDYLAIRFFGHFRFFAFFSFGSALLRTHASLISVVKISISFKTGSGKYNQLQMDKFLNLHNLVRFGWFLHKTQCKMEVRI